MLVRSGEDGAAAAYKATGGFFVAAGGGWVTRDFRGDDNRDTVCRWALRSSASDGKQAYGISPVLTG